MIIKIELKTFGNKVANKLGPNKIPANISPATLVCPRNFFARKLTTLEKINIVNICIKINKVICSAYEPNEVEFNKSI